MLQTETNRQQNKQTNRRTRTFYPRRPTEVSMINNAIRYTDVEMTVNTKSKSTRLAFSKQQLKNGFVESGVFCRSVFFMSAIGFL